MVTRKNISFAQQIAIDRHGDPYVYGGNWDPMDRSTGTDCSGCVIDELDAAINGTAMQWRRNADGGGGSTEDFRPYSMGGHADPTDGPFGLIMVDEPSEFPPDAAVLVAFHHGYGGGENSHTWCQVDGLHIETNGDDGTVLWNGAEFTDEVLDVHTVDGPNQYGANNWWYLPGPIVEDVAPVTPPPPPPPTNTLFFPDVSNNNWTSEAQLTDFLSKLHAEGFAGVVHKVSEGAGYRDPYWKTCRAWCEANNLSWLGYHYCTTDNPAAQANNFNANNGGGNVMLDFENGSGDISNFWALVQAFNDANVNVSLAYLPAWYHRDIGYPDLSYLTSNGIKLVSSNYPGGPGGDARDIYNNAGGDGGPGWASFGGCSPSAWQFTDQAVIAGFKVDCNVHHTPESDLDGFFTGQGI